MEALIMVAAIIFCLIVFYVRTKPTPRTVYFINDLVDVFDSYGCRVRGRITHTNSTAAYVDFIDSKGTPNLLLYSLDEIMKPGPRVMPKTQEP